MKILALTRYTSLAASTRLRFEQYFPYLRRSGLELSSRPFFTDQYMLALNTGQSKPWLSIAKSYLNRLWIVLYARKYNVLWIHLELFPNLPWIDTFILRVMKVPYVLDLDDAWFHKYDLADNSFLKLSKYKIDELMSSAALVVCGNQYIAERAIKTGASQVACLPTVVDLKRYTLSPLSIVNTSKKIIIGWIGSPSTSKYVKSLLPLLENLANLTPIKLLVIGAQLESSLMEVECRDWSEATEVSEILKMDIGIMPLRDSEWERGKCGYKLIQYMACAKPTIASPVGVNTEIVSNGVDGYLASSNEEWANAIRKLASDASLRTSFGTAARRKIEQKYCLEVTAPKLENLFLKIINNSKKISLK